MTDTEKHKIEELLLENCRQQGLFAPHSRVIAACSGGADSMALLLFLYNCRAQLGVEVEAVHVNHGLRETARRDEEFVADFCKNYGIPLKIFRLAEEGPLPETPGEDWARRRRYECFERQAAGRDALVATAHTRNDQAETLLLRLARGTGLHGAGGIRAVRGIYRRPLLCLSRPQTEEYCRCCGQNWMEDETNAGDAYARNRLRHSAMPALESVNEAAAQHITAFCNKMQLLDDYFAQKAEDLLAAAGEPEAYRLKILAEADEPVLTAALHKLVGRTRDPEEKYVRALREAVRAGRGGVQLTPQVCWLVQNDTLRCVHPGKTMHPGDPIPLAPGDYCLAGGYRLEIRVENYENLKKTESIHKKDLNCVADYAKIQNDIVLRTRREGDSYSPAGRGCTKTLKKLFNELKIPMERRSLLPLLAQRNRVVWLWGQGFAQGLAPDGNTRLVMTIQCETLPEEDVTK